MIVAGGAGVFNTSKDATIAMGAGAGLLTLARAISCLSRPDRNSSRFSASLETPFSQPTDYASPASPLVREPPQVHARTPSPVRTVLPPPAIPTLPELLSRRNAIELIIQSPITLFRTVYRVVYAVVRTVCRYILYPLVSLAWKLVRGITRLMLSSRQPATKDEGVKGVRG
jgi:hypothetical protein